MDEREPVKGELGTLREQLAECLSELQAHQTERERSQKIQAALYRIATAASAAQDMQAFYAEMHQILRELMYAESCYIATYDERTDLVSYPYWVDMAGDEPRPPEPLGSRKTAIAWVIQHGETLDDSSGQVSQVMARGELELHGTESNGIAAPLISVGRTLGALLIQSYDPAVTYSSQDVDLLSFVAQHIASALNRIKAIEETRQRNAELAITNSVGEAMAKTLDVKTITNLVGDKLREIFGAEWVAINLYDPQTEMINAAYVYIGQSFDAKKEPPLPLGSGLVSKLIVSRQPLLLHTWEEMEREGIVPYESLSTDLFLDSNSYIGVPIIFGEQVVGAVDVQNTKSHAFDENDLRLLSTLASNMGVAIQNARQFEETQQRVTELQIINSIQQGLASKLEFQSILDLVGDKLHEIFEPDVLYIAMNDAATNLTSFPYVMVRRERIYDLPALEAGGFSGEAIRTRRTVVVNEAMKNRSQQVGSYNMGSTEDPLSAVFVPILTGESVLGVLSLQSYEREHAFPEPVVRLLETLANSMSLALENARLFDETQQRNAELAIINAAQRSLASELDIRGIYEAVGEKLNEIFDVQTIAIYSANLKTRLMTIEYSFEKGQKFEPISVPFNSLYEYILGLDDTFLKNGDFPLFAADFEDYQVPRGEMPESLVVVPVIRSKDGDLVVVLALMDMDGERTFASSDIRLLETLANAMSVSLENARLFEETQHLLKETEQHAAELAIINSVQRGLAAQLDYQAIIDLVGDKIRAVFKADTTYIALYDRASQIIEFPYYIEKEHRHYLTSFEYGEGLTSHVIRSRQPLLIGTTQEQQGYNVVVVVSPDDAQDLNETYLGVPVVLGEEVMGVISVQSYKQHAYTDSDVRLLTTLAASMGVALENARLFGETQQRAAELSTVNTISQALVAETELEALIQITGEQMRQTFDADIVYVALLDPEAQYINFPYAHGEEFTPLKFGEGLTSKIIESGEPLLINRDMESRRAALGATQVGKQARSYLGVPIFLGKQAIGVISVQSTEAEGRFSENESRLLSTLAANVGTAIRNANLFDEVNYQKKYYEMIIANSPAAIVLIDEDTKVTVWNPAAERLFGYSQAEAIGHRVDDLVANQEEIHAASVAASNLLIKEGRQHLIDKRTRKDGTLVDVEIISLRVNIDSRQTGYIGIYHDITELQRARQDAIAANQAKSTFLANMSHELRTPLNAIIGFTRIVHRKGQDALPKKQLENLDKVLLSAEHLLGLINSVLDISKIEAGRMDVQLASFGLPQLVDLVVTTSQPLVRPGVKLQAELPPDPPQLYSDQDMVKQILLNLLSNAAKFTHEGQIILAARQDNEVVYVDVRDTGIGISAEALERVFEEFQQADSSTTRQYGGTGLGLSISRRLARLLGGDLTATSQEGSGSTFTLAIPVQYGVSPAVPTTAAAEGLPVGGDSRYLVLAIDDNPDVHHLLQENLGEAGFHVVGALSGDDGIQMAHDLNPFAITLDIMMPYKDGWQVLHELKADPHTRNIPVILLTIVDKKALGYRLGASDYLVKPLDEEAVLATLQRLAKAHGGVPAKRLLVVDDDPNIADMVRQLLADKPYQVKAAEDGLEAMQAIRERPPDVILLDLMMPHLDGFGLIAELQKDPVHKDIPVIVLTAKSLSSAERELLQENVTRIIEKNGLDNVTLVKDIQHALAQYE